MSVSNKQIAYRLSIDTDLDDLEWPWVTFNVVIALILLLSIIA